MLNVLMNADSLKKDFYVKWEQKAVNNYDKECGLSYI